MSFESSNNVAVAHLKSMRGLYLEFFAISSLLAFLSIWHIRIHGNLSLTVFASFVWFVFVCLAYGHTFLVATVGAVTNKAGLSFQFLSGFFIFNTLLFVLALISPLGMFANIAILTVGALGLAIIGKRKEPYVENTNDELPMLLSILVSGVAATLWCSDSQAPLLTQGNFAIYQTWQDTFIHVAEINTFSNAKGIDTIQDIKLSGVPAPIYHFASYLSAAAITLLTGTPAIDVYSSFLLPFGIFLTGLAAFSLITSIWGNWPALASVTAVVLLPDAYQQGFASKYLSYNFLAQVNQGLLYGIACAAIAWVFVLEGSRRGRVLTIVVGYLFLGICLFYRAHLFVANALLILIYPWLFFVGLGTRWRVLIVSLLTALFVVVVALSQTIDRVPVMRLDGSGIGQYIVILVRYLDEGYLKDFFAQVFLHEHHSRPVEGLYAMVMILLSTFGMWLAVTPLVAALGRKRATVAVLCFPIFIVANYLLMSMGLALDSRNVGTPDELLNRPSVWAYFAVVAWTAGGAYYLAIGNRMPRNWKLRMGFVVVLCAAMIWSFALSKDLQTFPVKQGLASYKEFNAVPLCLVKASQFIRDNSGPGEIIQDSENDPKLAVTALSERQMFAGQSSFGGHATIQKIRLDGLADFRAMRDVAELRLYAESHNISWYLLHPGSSVAWPAYFLREAVFDCDGYRVYHFTK